MERGTTRGWMLQQRLFTGESWDCLFPPKKKVFLEDVVDECGKSFNLFQIFDPFHNSIGFLFELQEEEVKEEEEGKEEEKEEKEEKEKKRARKR